MRTIKSAAILIGALVPIVYCGSLLYYFFDVGGSVKGVNDSGLGPTVLGLGIVGLLFCIPLLIKIVRLTRGPRAPGSGRGLNIGADDDENRIDADAAIARYLAERAAQPAATKSSGYGGSAPAKRTGFGRRI